MERDKNITTSKLLSNILEIMFNICLLHKTNLAGHFHNTELYSVTLTALKFVQYIR